MAIKEELENKTEEEKEDPALLEEEEITEDILWAGIGKIKMIYDKVDENSEVLFFDNGHSYNI